MPVACYFFIEVEPSDELLASLGRNHRHSVRRALRRAYEDGVCSALVEAEEIEQAARRLVMLHEHKYLQAALKAYEEERRASLLALQSAAHNSALWFETVQHHIDQEAINFAFSPVTRRQEATPPVKIPWHYQLHWVGREIAALRRLRTRSRRWFRSTRRGLRAGR